MVSRIAGQNDLQLRVLRGAGDDTLVYKDSRGGFPYTGFPTRPQTADLRGDCTPDLILETHTVIVLLGHGDMTIGRAQVIISDALQTGHVNAWSALLGLVLAHLNGDGHLDLALCREPDNIRRRLATGKGASSGEPAGPCCPGSETMPPGPLRS